MASTYLTRTTGTPTDHKKYTFSAWIKRCDIGAGNSKIFSRTWGSGGEEKLEWNQDDLIWRNTSGGGGSTNWERVTNRKFRDCSAFYHVCITFDSTQSTAGDRLKMWINGVQETSFSASSDPSLNAQSGFMDSGIVQNYGRYGGGGQETSAIWSHVHLTDGYAYAASDFGETDATTGEWKIKTSPSGITYGNNGFWWLKDNANTTDNSPNSNTFTVAAGTLTKTEDCPSNVFATMNPLDNQNQGSTFTMGNTKLEWNTNNKNNFATLAMNKGKFYWEIKYANNTGGSDAMIGMSLLDTRQGDDYPGHDSTAWSYYASNGNKYHSGGSSYGNSWTTNDIIGVAFDADTRTLWFSKNGTWQNSATISEIAAGTTTNAAWTGMGSAGDWFIPCMSGYDGNKAEFNFGNGYFSTTAITSAGSNASNLGLFEYDVPNNFTALSTKGLNE